MYLIVCAHNFFAHHMGVPAVLQFDARKRLHADNQL